MTVKEAAAHLNQKVRYRDAHSGIDSLFLFTGCIIRKNDRGVFMQAELQQNERSVIITSLDKIEVIKAAEGGVANEIT